MNYIIASFPAVLGALIVVQAGLNRKIATTWGLGPTVVFNSIVLLFVALAFYLLVQKTTWFDESMRGNLQFKGMALWYILPGIIGTLVVIGGPWAVAKWGATQTFVLLMSGQILASVLWDLKVEGLQISLVRYLGVAFTWIGVILATR